MTSISFNLSGKIEKPTVDALYLVKRVADSLNIPFFVIGASARDLILKHCYGIEPLRKTGDIDLGVEVANWEQFNKLKESLIATGSSFLLQKNKDCVVELFLSIFSLLVLSLTRIRKSVGLLNMR